MGDLRSDEPGDTWQNPDQKAFFTDKIRTEVLSEMQTSFGKNLGRFSSLSYRLNYRPEEAGEFVRDQLPSYYLEEIIHPLRESLFVNGWEPKNSPIFADIPKEERPFIFIKGNLYLSKVTLKPLSSKPLARILVWNAIFPAFYIVFISLKKSFRSQI